MERKQESTIGRVIKLITVPICIVLGGTINILGVYHQQHIIGNEGLRRETYKGTVYRGVESGGNFIDSKVTRTYITTSQSNYKGDGRRIVDGVEYRCDLPRFYHFRKIFLELQEKSGLPGNKVRMKNENGFITCQLMFD